MAAFLSDAVVGVAQAARAASLPRCAKVVEGGVVFKDILAGRIRFRADPGRKPGAQSRKISHAATTIRAKPAQWFHFNGWPRYQAENPAKTSSVITSCMPLSCGAL